jgi:hypothetical protein
MAQHTNLSTTDGVDLSFQQMLGAWRIMSAASPRRALASDAGLECIFSGVPVPFFNVALITDARVSAGALAAHGRRACAFAADKDVPWLFVVTGETLEEGVDPAAALDACGLVPAMPLTGMVASHLAAGRARDGRPRPRDPAGRRAVRGGSGHQRGRLRHGPRGRQAVDGPAGILGRATTSSSGSRATRRSAARQ